MILPVGHNPIRNDNPSGARAFTLIELILVMAMLLIVLAVSFPSLKGFFRGRDLDSEARRFLSLTRYGQSRAISEGVPMSLWIDARDRSYGLQAAAGYTDLDGKAVAFTLDKDLQLEVSMPLLATPSAQRNQAVPGAGGNLPMIRFAPDGSISDPSPERILIRQGKEDAI